jgi:hypothetical protein
LSFVYSHKILALGYRSHSLLHSSALLVLSYTESKILHKTIA